MTDDSSPLAARMRPQTIEEVVGQSHILGEGKLLRRVIEADRLTNVIFYGPPGCGKTTLAEVIAQSTKRNFTRLSGVVSGVADLDYIPKMAIIPQGTVNDMARNFGMPMSTKRSLKVLMENDCTRPHNIYRINDGYFDYTFALGVCSGVSYIDNKPLGPLSYYITAVKLFFKDKDVNIKMKINGEEIEGKYKFILVTNSEHIGGFKVKFYDKLAVVLIKGKRLFFPFQLLWYSITSRAKYKYLTDNLEIEADSKQYNADGEGVEFTKNIKIEKAKTINFLCTKRARRRYEKMMKKAK